MRWVACSISASTAESETICQGQTGQDRTVGTEVSRPIRSISYIRFSSSDGCTEPARGPIPGGLLRFVLGVGSAGRGAGVPGALLVGVGRLPAAGAQHCDLIRGSGGGK